MESEKNEFEGEQLLDFAQIYFVKMPYQRSQLIAMSAMTVAVTVVGVIFLYSQRKRRHDRGDLDIKTKSENDSMETHKNSNKKHRTPLEEMLLEEKLEEEMNDTEFQKWMGEKSKTRRQENIELDEIEREYSQNSLKRKEEHEEKLKHLKEQNRINLIAKEKAVAFETEQLRKQVKMESERFRFESKRSRRDYLQKDGNLDNEFDNVREKMKIQNSEREKELIMNDQLAEERKRESHEQFEQGLEELRRNSRLRKREMDNQFLEIQKSFRMKLWNDAVERNWSNRLSILRSSFQDILNAYNSIEHQGSSIMFTAIQNQRSLMENEKNDMEELYIQHKKPFLLNIKDAVEEVISESHRLSYVLMNEPSNKVRIKECITALSQASIAIPTIAELKQRHAEHMQS